MAIRYPLLACLPAACLLGACSPAEDDPTATAGDAADEKAAAAAPQRYDAEAFFATTSYRLAGRYTWSADDTELLITSDETGIYNAYALNVAGGTKRPLTSSTTDSTFAVSWFPGDERMLFTADQGGNELDHLHVREASGETRDLTPGNNLKAEFAGWTGDGSHFFVLTNERDPRTFDLYRYSAKDYERMLVFRNDEAFAIGAVSPDGNRGDDAAAHQRRFRPVPARPPDSGRGAGAHHAARGQHLLRRVRVHA